MTNEQTTKSQRNPAERFSSRVENYLRYRPRYPVELLEPLRSDCLMTPESVIADVGSGTGFLAQLFLENGNRVIGIEPNRDMREAGERLLQRFSQFESVAASAESTTLPERSVDFVTVGQAFHWFERERCRAEFQRILRHNGWVVLVWNDRRTDSTPFLMEYEQLLRAYGTDYQQVDHKQIDGSVLRGFFRTDPFLKTFPNFQRCDFEFLKGRLLSSSYVPEAGQPRYEPMLQALRTLFDTHQKHQRVVLEYDTRLYYGRLG